MNLKKQIFLLLIIMCAETFSQVSVEIILDKYEFLEAEPIIYRVKFKNNSNNIDSINYFAIDEFYHNMFISGPENKEILRGGFTSDFLGGIPYRKIQPHQEIIKIYNLLEHLGNIRLRYSLHGGQLYFLNGKYSLKYIYNNWLTSNEINIIINKPEESESKVFEKLLRAYQINDGNPWIMDSILLKQKIYYEIVTNYPHSVYWEEAVYRYNEETNWLKMDVVDTYTNKEFVKRFPDSYFLYTVFTNLCRAIYKYEGGEAAINAYLDYIMNNYQNYGVFSLAQGQLLNKHYLN